MTDGQGPGPCQGVDIGARLAFLGGNVLAPSTFRRVRSRRGDELSRADTQRGRFSLLREGFSVVTCLP